MGLRGTQAVGLGVRGVSSNFVLFKTQEDIRWSRSTAPVILSLRTRWNRVVRRFAAGSGRSISCLGGLGWPHGQSGRFVKKNLGLETESVSGFYNLYRGHYTN